MFAFPFFSASLRLRPLSAVLCLLSARRIFSCCFWNLVSVTCLQLLLSESRYCHMSYILMLTMFRGIVSVTAFSFNHLSWFSLLPSFGFVLWAISCLLDFSLAPSMPWTAFGLFLHHWWGLNSLSLYSEAMILTTALPLWFLLTLFSCKLLSERLEVKVQEAGKTLKIPI